MSEDNFPTQLVYYDKEMNTLISLFKQSYAILDKISRRRDRSETIQVSTSIFDYRVIDSLKKIHPNRFFNLTFGSLTVTAYRTPSGNYGIKILGPVLCPNGFHLEYPDTDINAFVSDNSVKDYDSLYDLFLNTISMVIAQDIKHELF